MSKIDLKKINNPNIERSDENHHFRVEVKSGHFKEGTSIGDANMDLMGHRTFVGLYAKESFEYGLLFNYFDPFPIPSLAIKSVRRNRYQQNKMLISGHLENPHLIARLDHKDYFRDKTFVDFRFGDFDGDGDPDLAYVTSQADGLIQSHIFYYEPILREDQSSMVIFELMNRFVRMHLIPHGEFHYSVIDRMKDAFSVVDRLAEGKRGSVEERAHDQVVTTLTDLSHRFVGQCVCHPRALREIAYYFDFLTKYEKRPEILSVVEWFNASVLSPQVYYPLLGRVASSETDDTRAAALVRLFSQVARRWAKSSEGVNRTVDLLLEIAPFLTIDQMRMLVYLYNETDQEERRTVSQFCKEFERIKGRPEEAYSELYKFLGGSDELSPDQLLKYVNLLDKRGSQARIHDIIAADKSIGPKGANLLAKKFKILRFGRYHPSVLQHMVDLIKNPFLDEDKPLILAMVAGYDHNDALYWGKFFKRDSRVRVIVLEIDTWENFKNLPWMVRREYGIPDVLMLTNHGQKHQIDLGRDEDDYVDYINLNFALRMKEAFHDFFGSQDAQIIVNACSVGGIPEDWMNGTNFAQMMADAFGREVRAARDIEGLLYIDVKVDREGQATLYPLFMEFGKEWFGLNPGGKIFKPHYGERPPEITYIRAADANIGWQGLVGLSVFGDEPALSAGVGYSHQFYHRLRLRMDLSVRQYLSKFKSAMTVDPEISVGLTNHLMAFASGGLGASVNGGVNPFLQFKSGGKLVFLPNYGELDIGFSTTNGWDPNFYLSYTLRF